MAEFDRRFTTEVACRQYLLALRWPNGFRCPRCSFRKSWLTRRGLLHCQECDHETSVTSGTIFHGTRRPLRLWFQVMWWVTGQKNGASALGLQRILGIRSYQTAWAWLHKLRRAMVRPGRDRLSGRVEVDETFVGGVEKGGGRRHIGKKALVAIAAEMRGSAIGRIRLKRILDSSAKSLECFVQEAVEPGSTVVTDGLPSYLGLGKVGYKHSQEVQEGSANASRSLPRVHQVASLLKRWLLGTHQGRVERTHLPYYLDEFVFRFNRRNSRARGLLFHRLAQQAVTVQPVAYRRLIGGFEDPEPAGKGQLELSG